jgi:hypothetical protein
MFVQWFSDVMHAMEIIFSKCVATIAGFGCGYRNWILFG